jgi:hypothetical protein
MGQGVRGAFNTTRNSSLECDYTPLFLVLISKFLKKNRRKNKKVRGWTGSSSFFTVAPRALPKPRVLVPDEFF